MLLQLLRVSRALGAPPSLVQGVLLIGGIAVGGCSVGSAAVDAPHAPSTDNDPAVSAASIATVHRRKCGNCHTRVEPGALPRATIEAAMARHRRRAKLTDGQWAELIEFLSRGGPSEPRHTASVP